jgi:hypothetical protein
VSARRTLGAVLLSGVLGAEVGIVAAGAPTWVVFLSGVAFVAGAMVWPPLESSVWRLRLGWRSRRHRAARTTRRRPPRDRNTHVDARAQQRRARHLESWVAAPQAQINRRLLLIEAEFARMQPLLQDLDDADAEDDRAEQDSLPRRVPGRAKSDLDEVFERLEFGERRRPADPRRSWRDGEQIVPSAEADAIHRAVRAILAAEQPDPRPQRREGTDPVLSDAAGPAPSAPSPHQEHM